MDATRTPQPAPAWAWPLLGLVALLACFAVLVLRRDGASTPPVLSVPVPSDTTTPALGRAPLPPTAARRFGGEWSPPTLIDVDGVLRRPGADPDVEALVFVFLGTECPISNGYLPELNRLHARFGSSIEMYGVIADRFTTPAAAAAHRHAFGIAFPVLLDTANVLRRRTGATVTPEACVIDNRGTIAYRGRIDDRYREIGRPRPAADVHDLRDAIAAVVAGKPPAVARTRAIGCKLEPLRDVADAVHDVTFHRDIAPILYAHCAPCHRKGEAAPFPLLSYEDAAQRATWIAEVVRRRVMPPWLPVNEPGHFLNERRLDEREIAILQRWADDGAPRGDEAHRPPRPTFSTGWQLGEPDLVLEMPEPMDVPADGPDLYMHFVIPTGLVESRLVSAFEFRPGEASVVHHAWVYFDDTGTARELDAADPRPGYERFGGPGFVPTGNLGGWGPGGTPRRLPDGMGRRIPAGSDLVLQVHYHPTGRAARDHSRLGLYFAPNADRLAIELVLADVDLEIPAGESRHRFEATYTLPVETDLLDTSPHMHLLGRAMDVTATTPDGRTIPLVRIDDWNFEWQDHYVFTRPVRLPAGTRLDLVAIYDNSDGNPHNPHSPPRDTSFGEQSDDEMGICYFQVTTPRREDLPRLARHSTEHFARMMERYERNVADAASVQPRERIASDPAVPAPFRNSLGMELVTLPAGTFTMGARDPERFAPYSRCEGPARRVTLSSPFAIGRHEVTVGQFRRFVEATGYRTVAERTGEGCNGIDLRTGTLVRRAEWVWSSPGFPQTDDHPVVCVDWSDAVAFCAWLSRTEGRTYRLPTEAEWEYACRGGTTTLFCSGPRQSDLEDFANAGDVALKRAFAPAAGTAAWDDGHAFTAPVGSFAANRFGLHDLHGNVGEWCSDWYDADHYRTAANVDPTGPTRGPWRVVRGGSWYNTPTSCRSSGRHDGIETARSITNGFRVVLERRSKQLRRNESRRESSATR